MVTHIPSLSYLDCLGVRFERLSWVFNASFSEWSTVLSSLGDGSVVDSGNSSSFGVECSDFGASEGGRPTVIVGLEIFLSLSLNPH
jgi:hypothetical protein